jgi:hypothetical protein
VSVSSGPPGCKNTNNDPSSTNASLRSGTSSPVNGGQIHRTVTQSRSRASSVNDRFARIAEDEGLEPPPRPTISSRVASGSNSPARELPGYDLPTRQQNFRSTSTPGFEGPMSLNGREHSPAAMPRLSRVPTEPSAILGARSNLRITRSRDGPQQATGGGDVFGDDQSVYSQSPSSFGEQRNMSWSTTGQDGGSMAKKAPPPPPPSRAKKPPPPPPLKRSALSTSEVPTRY